MKVNLKEDSSFDAANKLRDIALWLEDDDLENDLYDIADSIEEGNVDEAIELADNVADTLSSQGNEGDAENIWDAIAPLRQVSESHKNKKDGSKMALSEKRAYNAGYRAGLRKVRESAEDFPQVKELEDYAHELNLREVDDLADDISLALEPLKHDNDIYGTIDALDDILDSLDPTSENAYRIISKARNSLNAIASTCY